MVFNFFVRSLEWAWISSLHMAKSYWMCQKTSARHRPGRYDTGLTEDTALWSSSWRSCWYSMALDASMYLSVPFGYTSRSVCPCELELSRYAWTIAFEMSSLSAADPNGFSTVISSSSVSVYWQFFFARHLSLENWIKSLTSTAIGFRSGVSVSLRVTLNT